MRRMKSVEWVACFFGAANYDPAVFPDPYAFKLDRPNGNRQMSLGHGVHRCLGAPLARLESELTVRELLRRYERIERGGDGATWQGVSLLNHGPERNPVVFVRAS
jgi:cytochrome P450